MKILIEDKLVDYTNQLKIDGVNISFKTGDDYIPSEQCEYIVPGFIDRHIHGGYGFDFMDEDITHIEQLLTKLPKEGTTSVLATTTTMSLERIEKAIDNARKVKSIGTKIQGIHLEGPFLNPLKIGAQNPKYVIDCEPELIENNLDMVKMVSYAPELADVEFTKLLNDNDIKASCVHSNATTSDISKHMTYGLDSISHFYNGCSAFNHHVPGVVNAGLQYEELEVELICDGIHIKQEVIEFTNKVKNFGKIILVTDSIRAKGLSDGKYELGGQEVFKTGNEVRLVTGSLAGSVLPMNNAVKNFADFIGNPAYAFYSASSAVATSLNLTDVGFIREGYKFDVIELDKDFNILKVTIDGTQVDITK